MAVLTDKQMDKHIKERNFAKVYLIYGEEQMYVKKYTDRMRRKHRLPEALLSTGRGGPEA